MPCPGGWQELWNDEQNPLMIFDFRLLIENQHSRECSLVSNSHIEIDDCRLFDHEEEGSLGRNQKSKI